MAKGLWHRASNALRRWACGWFSDTPPPDEATVRMHADRAAKERLRERASRAIALADAAYSELTREVGQHQEMVERARALIGMDEEDAMRILSHLIDAETRLFRLTSRYKLFQQEAERQALTWLVARDAEGLGSVADLEQMSAPSETELLVNSGADREMLDAGVLAAIAEITAEVRQTQIEAALVRLKSGTGDLADFTVTDTVNLADIDELASHPRFRGIDLKM